MYSSSRFWIDVLAERCCVMIDWLGNENGEDQIEHLSTMIRMYLRSCLRAARLLLGEREGIVLDRSHF